MTALNGSRWTAHRPPGVRRPPGLRRSPVASPRNGARSSHMSEPLATASKSSHTSRPERSHSPSGCATSSRTTPVSRPAARAAAGGVSSTFSANSRCRSRSRPPERSTPCGWNWPSAPRFSSVAGEKGSGVSHRMRCASPGSRTSAYARPRTVSGSGVACVVHERPAVPVGPRGETTCPSRARGRRRGGLLSRSMPVRICGPCQRGPRDVEDVRVFRAGAPGHPADPLREGW